MRLISPGSVMKLTTRISAPRRRHTRGSTSYTRRIKVVVGVAGGRPWR
jgi:hypothetical protein